LAEEDQEEEVLGAVAQDQLVEMELKAQMVVTVDLDYQIQFQEQLCSMQQAEEEAVGQILVALEDLQSAEMELQEYLQ
jgi:hypothetical protein